MSGRLTITGSGTDWRLTFANASSATGPIRCWRYTFPPRVNALGVTQPPGDWQVGGNRPPPAPILAGRSTTGIPPGGTAAFGVRTDVPLSRAGPFGTAAISEDCVGDVPAPVEFGPQPAPPPPCRCKSLDTSFTAKGMTAGAHGFLAELRLTWILRCTSGAGRCKARFDVRATNVHAKRGLRLGIPPKPGSGGAGRPPKNIQCEGPCRRTSAGSERLVVSSSKDYYRGDRLGTRAVPSVEIEIEHACGAKRRTDTFEIAFRKLDDGTVLIDRKNSDLNGNGFSDAER